MRIFSSWSFIFVWFLFFSPDGDVSRKKCTSDFFALELAEAIVHLDVKRVYAGVSGPPLHPSTSRADSLSHSYLPVKSFIPLITGQRLYQQTTSGVFLHAFYTDYCISRFRCIIFNVIALWLVVLFVFFLSPPQNCLLSISLLFFLVNCFVSILSILG